MSKATVAKRASAPSGQTLKLTYKGGGTQTIVVKPGTPIVTFQPGTKADAKVGAKLLVTATKEADGSLKAARLAVGKDGFTPPMERPASPDSEGARRRPSALRRRSLVSRLPC